MLLILSPAFDPRRRMGRPATDRCFRRVNFQQELGEMNGIHTVVVMDKNEPSRCSSSHSTQCCSDSGTMGRIERHCSSSRPDRHPARVAIQIPLTFPTSDGLSPCVGSGFPAFRSDVPTALLLGFPVYIETVLQIVTFLRGRGRRVSPADCGLLPRSRKRFARRSRAAGPVRIRRSVVQMQVPRAAKSAIARGPAPIGIVRLPVVGP